MFDKSAKTKHIEHDDVVHPSTVVQVILLRTNPYRILIIDTFLDFVFDTHS